MDLPDLPHDGKPDGGRRKSRRLSAKTSAPDREPPQATQRERTGCPLKATRTGPRSARTCTNRTGRARPARPAPADPRRLDAVAMCGRREIAAPVGRTGHFQALPAKSRGRKAGQDCAQLRENPPDPDAKTDALPRDFWRWKRSRVLALENAAETGRAELDILRDAANRYGPLKVLPAGRLPAFLAT